MVAVRTLLCKAVSQKNCRSFLFFTASLCKDGDAPYSVEKPGIRWHLSVLPNAEGKDFSVYCCHLVRWFSTHDCLWFSLTDSYSCWYWRSNDVFVLGANFHAQLRPAEQLEDEIFFLVKTQSLLHVLVITWPRVRWLIYHTRAQSARGR